MADEPLTWAEVKAQLNRMLGRPIVYDWLLAEDDERIRAMIRHGGVNDLPVVIEGTAVEVVPEELRLGPG